MILSFTGHRPEKLGGYEDAVKRRLCLFAHRIIARAQPSCVISGMALGWDQAVAEAALLAGVPVTVAVPFEGQELKWPPRSQAVYRELLAASRSIVYVCDPGYAPWKMQRRNEWMVDNSDALVALWDGSDGGTANCVNYAIRKNKPWTNLWEHWK